jgi:putative endonuclease
MSKNGFVYILTNKNNTTLYTGVTNDLKRRVYEHKEKLIEGFTKKFNLSKLVYYEVSDSIVSAIEREKQIKNYSREKKLELVQSKNESWKYLYEGL